MSDRPLNSTAYRFDHPRWNGIPCAAQRCVVVVGGAGMFPRPWYGDLLGTERPAVRVRTHPEMGEDEHGRRNPPNEFFLDDEDDYAYGKLMNGGGPGQGHRTIIPESIVSWGKALPGSQ